MLKRSPLVYAALGLALPVAAILGAFAFQAAGYAPCDLCLKERLPYYAGIVLAAVTLALAWRGLRGPSLTGFALLALLFLGSAAFGAYHSGVEWGFWPGPADCTGALERASSMADFMHQLQTVKVVRCDAVAIRILGLSLAGWNVVVSLATCAAALAGAGRLRRA
jgi:disulfide bond formation protein DsbB